jgi:hypothetical protein
VTFEPPDLIHPVVGDVALGGGWYPVEISGGQRFQWVSNDATLAFLQSSSTSRQLALDIEPGPGVGQHGFELDVLDGRGVPVASVPVTGREVLRIDLPAGPPEAFRLHVRSGGESAPNDLRILNFRVFQVALSEARGNEATLSY